MSENSTPNGIIRTAVHTTGGINKKLLTPCRRIGLSRNRKCSSFKSPLANSSSEILNILSPTNSQTNVSSATTPNKNLSETNISVAPCLESKGKISSNIEKSEAKENRKLKKSIPANINLNETNINPVLESKDEEEVSLNLEKDKTGRNKRKKFEHKSSTESETDITSRETNVKSVSEKCNPQKIIQRHKERGQESSVTDIYNSTKNDISRRSKKSIIKKKICVIESDSEDETNTKEELINDNINHINDISINNRNQKQDEVNIHNNEDIISDHLKVATNKEIENTEDNDFLENATVNIKKKQNTLNRSTHIKGTSNTSLNIDEDEKSNPDICEESKNLKENLKKPKKTVKRKLSMKRSTSFYEIESDEEIFKSSPSKDSNSLDVDNTKIINDVIELEKTIQNKEMKLEELKQRQIYRNLHKLEDLQKETDIWKVGCQDALRDLLAKLQEHAGIDMSTLLQNLKAPSHLFTYDSENDTFS